MKVESNTAFQPVTITLETQEEFDVVYQLCNNNHAIANKLWDQSYSIRRKYKASDVNKTLANTWRELDKVK